MNGSGAACYVYNAGGVLGVRTNCGPEWWGVPEVNDFLDACPLGVHIGFDIVDRKPVERNRQNLPSYTGKPADDADRRQP